MRSGDRRRARLAGIVKEKPDGGFSAARPYWGMPFKSSRPATRLLLKDVCLTHMDGTENHSLNDLLPYRTNHIGDAAARHGHKSSLARFEPLWATPRRLKSQRITLAAAWNNRKLDAWGEIWFRLRPQRPKLRFRPWRLPRPVQSLRRRLPRSRCRRRCREPPGP